MKGAGIMTTKLLWLRANRERLAVALFVLLAVLGVAVYAQEVRETYSWSAELVALDEAAHTVTVKAPIVSDEAGALRTFKTGEHVTVLWSGLHDRASGIRRVAREGTLPGERFAMPVQFVSAEQDGRHVSFKVTVPTDQFTRIKSLSPGDWITASTPVGTTGRMTMVTTIRGYNDIG
jgi:hypothetical protein